MKSILFIFLMLVFSKSLACECSEFDKSSFLEFMNFQEYAFYGKAMKPAYIDEYLNDFYQKKGGGIHVIYEIDSVIKGDLKKGDKIIIYQNSGSCDEFFEFQKSHLILGQQIKNFKKVDDPINSELKDGILFDYLDDERLAFYNSQASEFKIIYTDQCSTFASSSETHRRIRNWIK